MNESLKTHYINTLICFDEVVEFMVCYQLLLLGSIISLSALRQTSVFPNVSNALWTISLVIFFLSVLQASDGSYTGFIKVHLRLSRPVTVLAVSPEAASRQMSGSSLAPDDQERTECGQSEKGTSFYLPSDCVKQLHISSLTTTGEVIQGLLKKFLVLDNPRKFALYRQTHRDGQGEEKNPTQSLRGHTE